MWIINNDNNAYNTNLDITISVEEYNKAYSPMNQWRKRIIIDFNGKHKLIIDDTYDFFENLKKQYDLNIMIIIEFINFLLDSKYKIIFEKDLKDIFLNCLKGRKY